MFIINEIFAENVNEVSESGSFGFSNMNVCRNKFNIFKEIVEKE